MTGASFAELLLRRARQLSHEPDGTNCVTAVSAHVTGERKGNGTSALGEGFPVTGVVFCQTRGRRLIAHGSEKSTVCATENIESEKLLRCAHLSLDIGFCGPLQMTQYTRELIEGKGAWQLRSGSQEERVVPEAHNLERENLGLDSVREDSGGQLRSVFLVGTRGGTATSGCQKTLPVP